MGKKKEKDKNVNSKSAPSFNNDQLGENTAEATSRDNAKKGQNDNKRNR